MILSSVVFSLLHIGGGRTCPKGESIIQIPSQESRVDMKKKVTFHGNVTIHQDHGKQKMIIIISSQHKTKIAPEGDHIPQSLTRGM